VEEERGLEVALVGLILLSALVETLMDDLVEDAEAAVEFIDEAPEESFWPPKQF
jgi:hypothetical protein